MRKLEWIEGLARIDDRKNDQIVLTRDFNGERVLIRKSIVMTNHVRTEFIQNDGKTVRDCFRAVETAHRARNQIESLGNSGIRNGEITDHAVGVLYQIDATSAEKSNQLSLSWCESLKSRLNFVNRRSDMKSFLKLIALGLFLVVPALGAQAADRIGKVKIASGDVSISRDGVKITAESGAELFESDVITTGTNSAVGMTFADNSRVSLGPDSSLELEKFAHQKGGSKDGFDLRIRHGSLTAASGEIAKTRPLAMRVLMPTTVLGVKGTEFAVRVGKSG